MANVVREIDDSCDYRSFIYRNNGRIPCLAIGKDSDDDFADNKGEITGIYFQKVDEGKVQACLDCDLFSQVEWPNAPTRPLFHPNLDLVQPIFVPPLRWHNFGSLLFHIHTALITQMTSPDGSPPDTLYDGFAGNVWKGGINNKREETPITSQVLTVKQMLGQNWENNKLLQEFVETLISGFTSKLDVIKYLLDELLNIIILGERYILQAPAETLKNKSLREGMMHCLVYGFHPSQIELAQRQGLNQNRGRLRHRVILPKALDSRVRSMSRSPSPVTDLFDDVKNTRNQQPAVNFQEVLQNPNDYELKSYRLHSYFELHKPDFLIVNEGNNFTTTAKVVIEVSSYVKYGRSVSYKAHLKLSTEHCLQQCLAGISHNQQVISGLIVVPDGIKLIEVKMQNHGYTVKETDIIRWHETGRIYALLQYLEDAIQ